MAASNNKTRSQSVEILQGTGLVLKISWKCLIVKYNVYMHNNTLEMHIWILAGVVYLIFLIGGY